MSKETYVPVEKVRKVQRYSYDYAEKLIYEWVKTDQINLAQFRRLCQINKVEV